MMISKWVIVAILNKLRNATELGEHFVIIFYLSSIMEKKKEAKQDKKKEYQESNVHPFVYETKA